MATSQLQHYVYRAFRAGLSEEEARRTVDGLGWSAEQVDAACAEARKRLEHDRKTLEQPPKPLNARDWTMDLSRMNASEILLYLGSIIVVIAGITYIGINWRAWGKAARITAIFLPMIALYAAGAAIWLKRAYHQQALVFLVTGSLLFPFFLFTVFKELQVFPELYGTSFNLTIAAVTLIAYLILGMVFPSPIWTFVQLITGFITFYFGLDYFGIDKLEIPHIIAWSYLSFGMAYLFISNAFQLRPNSKRQSEYANAIGALVAFGALFTLINARYASEEAVWVLVLPALFLCTIGALYDLLRHGALSRTWYVLGIFTFVAAFTRLSMTGAVLTPFIGVASGQDAVRLQRGWSLVLVGILYLGVSRLLAKSKAWGFVEASRYETVFDLFGVVQVLGGVMALGLGGHHFLYETLLLALCLAFIFASVWKVSKAYLYAGTLFLIIYIFSTGSEYFKDEVSWPIILFVAGLLSMGVGFGLGWIKRKYFK